MTKPFFHRMQSEVKTYSIPLLLVHAGNVMGRDLAICISPLVLAITNAWLRTLIGSCDSICAQGHYKFELDSLYESLKTNQLLKKLSKSWETKIPLRQNYLYFFASTFFRFAHMTIACNMKSWFGSDDIDVVIPFFLFTLIEPFSNVQNWILQFAYRRHWRFGIKILLTTIVILS